MIVQIVYLTIKSHQSIPLLYPIILYLISPAPVRLVWKPVTVGQCTVGNQQQVLHSSILHNLRAVFGSVRSSRKANLHLFICLFVRSFGPNLSRALNLHILAQVSLSSLTLLDLTRRSLKYFVLLLFLSLTVIFFLQKISSHHHHPRGR